MRFVSRKVNSLKNENVMDESVKKEKKRLVVVVASLYVVCAFD